jgi:hypothetical protein
MNFAEKVSFIWAVADLLRHSEVEVYLAIHDARKA